jgi:hypothetical protein
MLYNIFIMPIDWIEFYCAGSLTFIFLLLSFLYVIDQPGNRNKLVSVEPETPRVVVKYEDKYLDKLKSVTNDLDTFTEEELETERVSVGELKEKYETILTQDIANLKDEIQIVQNQIKEYKEEFELSDEELFNIIEKIKNNESDMDANDLYDLIVTKDALDIKLVELEGTSIKDEDIQKEVHEKTINTRRDKLMNSYVMEKTPLGNVAMRYNNSRGTFEYYADNTIPYRLLEVVARKYVITYNCKSLYVNMEDELKKYEEKMEVLKKEQEEKLAKQKEEIEKNGYKNVFAKFKSYNNNNTTSAKSAAAQKTNNMPIPAGLQNLAKQVHSEQSEAEKKHLLKENANRYSCEGHFSGFNILKRIDRKVVDKKYALSFSEFKKLRQK